MQLDNKLKFDKQAAQIRLKDLLAAHNMRSENLQAAQKQPMGMAT